MDNLTLIVGLSIISFVSIAFAVHYKGLIGKPLIQYIDTSGIGINPSQNFVETWTGKTLNIRVSDKHILSIADLPAVIAYNYLDKISALYDAMNRITADDKLNQTTKAAQMLNLHNGAKWMIYKMCIKTSRVKRGFKRAFFERSKNDFMFIIDAAEQVTDYWRLVKRKALLLSRGATLRQTDGYSSTWDTLSLDKAGKTLIQPRFAG